ncbi:pilin [Candidatus Gracilibacteria bacterium]|nr:pilin [Candidatus Gracilibacteria bacterium]MCF7856116.1 pilin [Candidatus Gracilibacteria bacterium]MCF7896535.1 pilin [Candidatus Gracilibacteria bacterium]
MIKINKSRNNRIVTGVILGAVVLVVAIFGRVAGENLKAAISIDGILPGISIDTDEFSLNAGGGSNQAPGCGGGNCLVAPDAGEYSGIAVETSFRQFLITWTNFALRFLALIAMIALIYAGFLYVTAAGNDEQAGKAKKIIIWVVTGIVVILLAYALVNTLITKGPTGSDL